MNLLKNKKHTEIRKETAPLKMKRGQKKLFALYAVMVLSICIGATCVYAAGDPLTVVNNLSTFIFSLIRAIGLILLGFGIVQVGLSLKSHDPSQRANGFLTLAGGIIITFAKEILDLIMVERIFLILKILTFCGCMIFHRKFIFFFFVL